MPTWNSDGLEVDVLVVDERPIIPEITVEIIATGEKKVYDIGQLRSSSGDIDIYRNADKVIREDASETSE